MDGYILSIMNGFRLEWEYDYEVGDDAEVKKDGDSRSDAQDEIEALIDSIDISVDRSFDDMISEVLDHLEINESDVQELDLEIEYDNDTKIKLKFDLDE